MLNTVGLLPYVLATVFLEDATRHVCAMSKFDIVCRKDLGRYRGTIDTLSQSSADSSESTGVEGATNEMSVVRRAGGRR